MMDASLTKHAAKRMQQRGIPDEVLPLLLSYGRTEHDHRGACLVYLTKKGREQIARVTPRSEFKKLEPALDVYAVVDTEGHVLTIGHRTQRINRH